MRRMSRSSQESGTSRAILCKNAMAIHLQGLAPEAATHRNFALEGTKSPCRDFPLLSLLPLPSLLPHHQSENTFSSVLWTLEVTMTIHEMLLGIISNSWTAVSTSCCSDYIFAKVSWEPLGLIQTGSRILWDRPIFMHIVKRTWTWADCDLTPDWNGRSRSIW